MRVVSPKYIYTLKYVQKIEKTSKNKNRKRNIIYFNPPYSKSVETNIGQKFLNLIKKCFPKVNPLSKIFNKNSIKVTYSCLPNMGARIAGSNKQKLNSESVTETVGKCTCRRQCPVNGDCKIKDTIYEAVITDSSNNQFKYLGKSSTEFIKRYRNHKKAIKNVKYRKNCELSKKTWDLKEAGIDFNLNWNIRKQAMSYKPGNAFCYLCLEEINQILFYNEKEHLLNTRNELYKKCRHRTKFKLNFGIK